MDTAAANRRCEAATPEPWEFVNGFYGWDMGIFPVGCKDKLNEAVVANNGHSNGDLSQADGDFIAHARTDLPAALEALEEAQKQIAKWKASRIAFQDVVYAACNVVDAYLGSKVGLETLVEDELAGALESVLGNADEAQGKLEAVEEWGRKWPWSGLLGEAKCELDRILRGKEGE